MINGFLIAATSQCYFSPALLVEEQANLRNEINKEHLLISL
jgi:hypothetical protein